VEVVDQLPDWAEVIVAASALTPNPNPKIKTKRSKKNIFWPKLGGFLFSNF
jgi:hypothetical protein